MEFSSRVKNLSGNAIREIFKLLANPEVISFAGGMPATQSLPIEDVSRICGELLVPARAAELLQYGQTEGYLPLRKSFIEYVRRVGINDAALENVLIVSGGQQGIDLTVKAFVNPGDVVLVEDPTYLAVLHILKTYEAKPVGVRSGEAGIDLDDLEQKFRTLKPKLFYVVPNFSNPTGRTLSLEKRKAIYELAAKYDVPVLEDDPYRELRYSGEPIPSIKSFDKTGHVLYLTSVSKTVSPALRVGVVVGSAEIVRKLTIGKQAVDVHTPTLNQAIANEFLKNDYIIERVKAYLPLYRDKRDCMLDCLDKYMPASFSHTVPEGGLFIFGTFDPASGINCKANFQKAVAEHLVAYVCGSDFYADGSGENTMRLNFSNESFERIEEGVKRLGKLFKE